MEISPVEEIPDGLTVPTSKSSALVTQAVQISPRKKIDAIIRMIKETAPSNKASPLAVKKPLIPSCTIPDPSSEIELPVAVKGAFTPISPP